jgi:hypothetical protein
LFRLSTYNRAVIDLQLRRRARFALIAFLATVCVTLLAPILHPLAYELVCSAQGTKVVVHGDSDVAGVTHGSVPGDHAAHCPLCMPAGVPPTAVAWDFTPVQPLAHVQQSIPAARLATLVGAPLPARGPPLAA